VVGIQCTAEVNFSRVREKPNTLGEGSSNARRSETEDSRKETLYSHSDSEDTLSSSRRIPESARGLFPKVTFENELLLTLFLQKRKGFKKKSVFSVGV